MGVQQGEEVYLEIKKLLDIPSDEPIFIIRAQDQFAVPTLADYLYYVTKGTSSDRENIEEWFNNMREIGNNFLTWQRENVDKVKVPD